MPIDEANGLLCAVDAVAGGTQCALNLEKGILANVTNVRLQPHNTGPDKAISRGILVSDAAHDELDLDNTVHHPERYAGYNLLKCNLLTHRVEYITNNTQWTGPKVSVFTEGSHAVSNSYLNDETWPKVVHLKKRLEASMESVSEGVEIETFMETVAQPLNDASFGLTSAPANMSTIATAYPLLKDSEVDLQDGVWVSSNTPHGEFRTRYQTVVASEVTEDGKTLVHYWYRGTNSPTDHDKWSKFTYSY